MRGVAFSGAASSGWRSAICTSRCSAGEAAPAGARAEEAEEAEEAGEAEEAAKGVQMEVVEMVGVAEGGPKRRRNA